MSLGTRSPQQSQAWYTYPISGDRYGGYEPYGNFPKPDLNIAVPSGVPVTSVSPGVVSGVDAPGGGVPSFGHVVTVRLDSPINAVATHVAYLHLANVQVSVGQRVELGTVIGYSGGNNPGYGLQQAPVGVAFYAGDYYGYGPTWSQYIGSKELDPTAWWSQISHGNIPTSGGGVTPLGFGLPDFSPLFNFLSGLLGLSSDKQSPIAYLSKPIRIVKLVIGATLLVLSLVLLVYGLAGKVAPLVKKAAVLAV